MTTRTRLRGKDPAVQSAMKRLKRSRTRNRYPRGHKRDKTEYTSKPLLEALGIEDGTTSLIRTYVKDGLSANRIQGLLSLGGIGMRRQTLLATIRKIKGEAGQ